MSMRGRVVAKKGSDQIWARCEAELDGITGGLYCWKHGGYGVIIRNPFLKSFWLLSDEWPLREDTNKCLRCCVLDCDIGCRWAYLYIQHVLGKPNGFK